MKASRLIPVGLVVPGALVGALLGLPLHHLSAPLLFACVVGAAFAVLVGAPTMSRKLGAWALGLFVLTTAWPGFSHALQGEAASAWADPRVRIALAVLAVGAVLSLVARCSGPSPASTKPVRPTTRMRAPVIEPVQPELGALHQDAPSQRLDTWPEDELGLFDEVSDG